MASGDPFWKRVSSDAVVKVVSGTLATLILVGVPLAFSSVREWVAHCWAALFEPVEVVRWWWLVLWGVFFLFGIQVIAGRARRGRQKAPDWPELYTEDEIFGILWRWRNSTPGRIVNLTPYCLHCQRLLRYHREADSTGNPSRDLIVACQGCNFRRELGSDPDETEKHVQIEIIHRIDTGLWAKRALLAIKKRVA